MSRRYYIATMGCQMNEYDSDYMAQLLETSNYRATDNPKRADLVLINTCSVRAKAEQKAYSLLGRMASLKRTKPGMILGMMGCIAQQEGSHLMKRFPELDLVVGTREVDRIQEIVERADIKNEKIVATNLDKEPRIALGQDGHFRGRVKSFLSIMEGCNNYCSYCVVPYVRGREVSRSVDEILDEARNLVLQGVREITLLGQNVNSYAWQGGEGGRRITFPMLLRRLNGVEGLSRIRFTTSHPKDLSEDLIGCFEKLDKLCPHIHLPVQSGSNRVLKLMNRGYTREHYMGLIDKLRDVCADMAITSDLIVGFPQETEEDFQKTLDLIEKVQFDNIYSFKYSDRKGTLAEKMQEKLGEDEKSRRLALLQDLQRGITLKKNRKLEGKIVEILVEGESKKGIQLTGKTRTNKSVNFICNYDKIGHLVDVSIKHSFVNSLQAEFLKDHSLNKSPEHQ